MKLPIYGASVIVLPRRCFGPWLRSHRHLQAADRLAASLGGCLLSTDRCRRDLHNFARDMVANLALLEDVGDVGDGGSGGGWL